MKTGGAHIFLIVSLLLLALVMRLFLLFTSQHYLDGDEAVVGIMAKHIMERGEHPLFWYGLAYNGGGSWEAHLGALMFSLLGYSDLSLKLAALIISLLILAFLYLWVRDNFGLEAGLIAAYFYVFSVSFVQWNLKLRGHLTLVFCMTFLLWLYHRFLFRSRRGWVDTLLVGLSSGLAVWCLETSIILVFVFLTAWLYADWKIIKGAKFWSAAGMFFIGASPLIYVNLTHGLANIRHLMPYQEIVISQTILQKIWTSLSYNFPIAFQSNIVHNYPVKIEWWGWAGYLIAAAASVYLVFKLCSAAKDWARSRFRRLSDDGFRLVFIALFFALFLLIFTFSAFSALSPRYLLPIIPVVFALTAVLTRDLLHSGKFILKTIAVAVILLWGFMGVRETLAVSKDYTVIDGYTPSDGRDMLELTQSLRELGIRGAYTGKFIKWRLIFYSGEEITASRFVNSEGKPVGNPARSLYRKYEYTVSRMDDAAYIFGAEPQMVSYFREFLESSGVNCRSGRAGSYSFFYQFEPAVKSGDFIEFLNRKGIPREIIWRSM